MVENVKKNRGYDVISKHTILVNLKHSTAALLGYKILAQTDPIFVVLMYCRKI